MHSLEVPRPRLVGRGPHHPRHRPPPRCLGHLLLAPAFHARRPEAGGRAQGARPNSRGALNAPSKISKVTSGQPNLIRLLDLFLLFLIKINKCSNKVSLETLH